MTALKQVVKPLMSNTVTLQTGLCWHNLAISHLGFKHRITGGARKALYPTSLSSVLTSPFHNYEVYSTFLLV